MTAQRHPTGTVTFLFTDIEGSTARWESHREAMQAALRSHDAILQESLAAHNGYVFKTIGDAFCAAFADPHDAILAAAEVQRRIAAENWDAIGGLRVRMAIHVGATDERDGDYFGPPVNRVARLLSAGHGGQVLVSGVVSDAVASQLSEGLSLRALGVLPLRDLKEPERVHLLLTPGLTPVEKPLRSLQTPPNNLPRQTSALVGRTSDTMRAAEMLRHGRLVTIVAAGGIGKTRLALEVAASLLNESTDGAWFVDLAPISDPALVGGTILAALGAPQTDGTPAVEQLIAYLRARSLLLILDNCEHLVGEAATIVHAVLANCPEVAVLATSREALRISGEQEYHLAPLDESSAVELFADRARAANPRFVLDEPNRAAVEKICRRLDGIALGVELAAARVKTMPVTTIAERLELRMLTGGGRERSERQQTMNALVGWSYDLLTDDEKAFFRSLAVFAGGMTLESVTAVYAGELDEWAVLELLTSLVEKSLLVAEPPEAPRRYRMLEPIREYGHAQLKSSAAIDEALSRHARGFAETADRAYAEWDTSPAADWLERQEVELDNVRSALRWSLEVGKDPESGARIASGFGPVFLRLSLLREGIDWGDAALSFAPNISRATLARLHYALSMLHNNMVSYGAALEHAESAVRFYHEAGDLRGQVRALSQTAQQLAKSPRSVEAATAAKQALSLARGLDDRGLLASVLARCANAAGVDEIQTSRLLYEESVELFFKDGRSSDAARVLDLWAGIEAIAGNLSEAAAIIDKALPVATGETKMWALTTAVTIRWALGERDSALPSIRQALELAGKIVHPVVLPFAVSYVALVAGDRDAAEAARLIGYADERRRQTGRAMADIERQPIESLRSTLMQVLGESEWRSAIAQGERWSDEHAYARAKRF